jgi:hypothetical protein
MVIIKRLYLQLNLGMKTSYDIGGAFTEAIEAVKIASEAGVHPGNIVWVMLGIISLNQHLIYLKMMLIWKF